jgi:hypothetical protein
MVDLRNHGRSPHTPQHTYAHMLPDLQVPARTIGTCPGPK